MGGFAGLLWFALLWFGFLVAVVGRFLWWGFLGGEVWYKFLSSYLFIAVSKIPKDLCSSL